MSAPATFIPDQEATIVPKTFVPDEANPVSLSQVKPDPYQQADLAFGGKAPDGMRNEGDFAVALYHQFPKDVSRVLGKVMEPIEQAAATVFRGQRDASLGDVPPDALPYTRPVEPGQPMVPELEPEPGVKGVIPSLRRFLAGLTTPGMVATLPFAGSVKAVPALFAAQGVAGMPSGIQDVINAPPGPETQGAVTDFGLNVLFTGLMAKSLYKGGATASEPATFQPDTRTPEQLYRMYQDVQPENRFMQPTTAQPRLSQFDFRPEARPTESVEDLQAQLRDAKIDMGMEEPKASGAGVLLQDFRGSANDGTQMVNRLRNRLHPSEWQILEDAGIRQFEGKKVPVGELAKWVDENGPRVEVRKLEAEGASKAAQRLAEVRHKLDTLSPGWNREGETSRVRAYNESSPEIKSLIDEEFDLSKSQREERNESATARYTTVNPKPLDQMPGAVDLLVRIPVKEGTKKAGERGFKSEGVKFPSEQTHYKTEGDNLVAHLRGYNETLGNLRKQMGADHPSLADLKHLSDDAKVFRVFEVQSDWAQRQRDYKEQIPESTQHEGTAQGDPLLAHYERLAIKAAIEHAREKGADAIAVDDAETAMITEDQHNASNVRIRNPVGEYNVPELRDKKNYSGEPELTGKVKVLDREDQFARKLETKSGEWIGLRQTQIQPDWLLKALPKEYDIAQEKGMRLHYDQTLPKIARELTGDEGRVVDFGEHQNAFEERDNVDNIPRRPRSDLIFRNPDGSPKTTSTARLYDISKTQKQFSLFNRDKPPKMEQGEPDSPSYRKYDVRTPEGKRVIELRTTPDLLKTFGIEPGIAQGLGETRGRQGVGSYKAFNKLSQTELYDMWDRVKTVFADKQAKWKEAMKTVHPDVGGDPLEARRLNSSFQTDETIFNTLKERFTKLGVGESDWRDTLKQRFTEKEKLMAEQTQQTRMPERSRSEILQQLGPVITKWADALPEDLRALVEEHARAKGYEEASNARRKISDEFQKRKIDSDERREFFQRLAVYTRFRNLPEDVQSKAAPKREPPPQQSEPMAERAFLTERDREHYDALKLDTADNMHDVVSNMAESPKFSKEERALAAYLRDNFEHVLRTAGVSLEGGPRTGRAAYLAREHQAYLALDSGVESNSLSFKVLEEGTHAALFWQLENPATETHRAAVAELKDIFAKTKENLPETEKFKLSDEYLNLNEKGPQDGLAYRYNDFQEWAAGLISDNELQEFLKGQDAGGAKPLWQRVWHSLLDVLDIPHGSALDSALQELTKIGADRTGWARAVETYERNPVDAPVALKAKAVMDELSSMEKNAPSPPGATVRDRRLREAKDAMMNQARRWSAPKHAAADENAANKLVAYASARQAAPEIAKAMASTVLDKYWQDSVFDKILGSVLVEERLRAVEKSFRDQARAATDPAEQARLLARAMSVNSVLPAARLTSYLANPEVAAAITRHKDTVQREAQQMHTRLGGKLASAGESTDAFVNLIAMLNPESVPTAKSFIFGSTKGNLENPLRRASAFGKETKGTAPSYDLSYRKIAERMIRGNYEEVAKQDYYDALKDAGLAVEMKPGQEAPATAKGVKLKPMTIERRGAGPGMTRVMKLWIRPDLKDEMMHALNTDQPIKSGVVRRILDVVSEVQVQGPTDALYHTANMIAVLAGSEGSKLWIGDMLRKGTGGPIGVADSIIRMVYHGVKGLHDAPETQRLWADISRIGAGRAEPMHKSVIPGLGALGMLSQKAIRFLDKGGRMAASKMFDNLVQRGLVEDTVLDRREFINRLGQYNTRLIPHYEALARELSISSFIVAGKNMNLQALRRLTGSPGFRAANPEAWMKSRATELLTLGLTAYAIPIMANLVLTGKWQGRPGTPSGAVDTGKNDKDGRPIVIDPLQLLLLRRARRLTGWDAYNKAQAEHLTPTQTGHEMFKTAADAYIHPWMGPGARFVWTLASGREPSVSVNEGYLQAKNPNSFGSKAIAAAKNMNPTVAQMLKGHEEGTGEVQTPLWSMGGAVGYKRGRTPSWVERQQEVVAKDFPGKTWEQLNAVEKRSVQRKLDKEREEQPRGSELGRLAAGERDYWKQAERTQELRDSLPKEQQKWVKQQKLEVSGYGEEFTIGKVRLPSTPSEQAALAKAMTKEYSEVIRGLMGTDFNNLPLEQKQLVLDKQLRKVRQIVKREFEAGALH